MRFVSRLVVPFVALQSVSAQPQPAPGSQPLSPSPTPQQAPAQPRQPDVPPPPPAPPMPLQPGQDRPQPNQPPTSPDQAPPSGGTQSDPSADAKKWQSNLDKIRGFRGLEFGSSVDDAGELHLEQDRGRLKLFRRSTDKLMLGPVRLETIIYYFFDEKFYGVALHTNDGEDSRGLQEVLTFALGPGHTSGPSSLWIGKSTGVIWDLNMSTGDSSAFIFDVKAHDAYLKYQSEAAEKAAQELLEGK